MFFLTTLYQNDSVYLFSIFFMFSENGYTSTDEEPSEFSQASDCG